MKAVIILSGGLDSTTLTYDLKNQGYDLFAISLNYGQRHKKELKMAKRTCKKLNIPHKIINITSLNSVLQGSSLTSPNIDTPHGRYDEENMKSTVVSNRNMILLSIAAGYGISIKAEKLFYGAHNNDAAIYPDCRPEFVNKLKETILIADWHRIELEAPYLYMNKIDIVKRGKELNVPFEDTWSCYEGKETPCGKCGSCVERAEAFKLANMIDPL